MTQVTILSIGKTREAWLKQALAEYEKRLRLSLHFRWVRDDEQLIKAAEQARLAIGLDPSGKAFDSPAFTQFFTEQIEKSGAHLTFVIGGPDGLPAPLQTSLPLLSLSPMTFTHQLSRLILVEQLYRVCEIRRGSPYHR